MPTFDIPFEECVRLRRKLQDILKSQEDSDIKSLLDVITSACSNDAAFTQDSRPSVDAVITAASNNDLSTEVVRTPVDAINTTRSNDDALTEVSRPRRNKRAASDVAQTDDSPRVQKASKPHRNADAHNTRNDTRRRNACNNVPEAICPFPIYTSPGMRNERVEAMAQIVLSDCLNDTTRHTVIYNRSNETTPHMLHSGPLSSPHITSKPSSQLDDESELSSLMDDESEQSSLTNDESELSSLPDKSAEEETLVEDVPRTQNPRRRMPKTKQTKEPIWLVVDDVRVMTKKASKLVQKLAAIDDQANMTRLLKLRDKLSGQTHVPDTQETLTLEMLVLRCEQSALSVAESKFKHMVNLMQLSLWLDQYVLSLYISNKYTDTHI
jgi:hypothetical protein